LIWAEANALRRRIENAMDANISADPAPMSENASIRKALQLIAPRGIGDLRWSAGRDLTLGGRWDQRGSTTAVWFRQAVDLPVWPSNTGENSRILGDLSGGGGRSSNAKRNPVRRSAKLPRKHVQGFQVFIEYSYG
jgi:hypothetical protein